MSALCQKRTWHQIDRTKKIHLADIDAVVADDTIIVAVSPLRGDGPTGPTLVGSDGPSADQVRTNGPSAGYKNVDATASNKKPNENNKSESSTAKAESLDDVLIKEGIGATKKPAKVS